MNEDSKRREGQIRRLLLIGFGGLLLLLAFTGLNALSVLKRIQSRDAEIRADYVNRDRILQELRSDIYLSGTYARDELFDPDPAGAEAHRRDLDETEARIRAKLAAYRDMLRKEERQPLETFRNEVEAYFTLLRPALEWNAEERRRLGYAFMQNSLLPRRLEIVRLADKISAFNQHQLEAGSDKVAELFSNFRGNVIALLVGTLLLGLVLAGGSVYRVLHLEQLSAHRLDELLLARRDLRELSARLLDAQEAERRAISRELHDEIGQSLSALLLAIGNVAAAISAETISESRTRLQEIRKLVERTVVVVRDMSLLLRPSMLDDLGLIPALEWQAREVSRTYDINVTVKADSIPDDLPDEQRTCIFRVVQEALRNVTRHARAANTQIILSRDKDQLHLVIQDDGRGFSPEREKGLGLLGIQERIRHLNGSFHIDSRPGGGTTLKVDVPSGAYAREIGALA